ncbi:DNA adenine methylase [Schaalia sp. lx-100]|uniref:DNA adenine methylase n=1 Tax=Schaalia sp. lx-100 TaxID=2899081 RepID=UPI001E3B851D|nr:DNA adenine methylase [Schaalia sp. lx-100]MCD4557327.1 DNA adenine methylase [Schaalia sp. lx-100]
MSQESSTPTVPPSAGTQSNQIKIPLSMQYLGSKTRIADWIVGTIKTEFPNMGTLHDLMAGTGAVSFKASLEGMRVSLNDIQPYAAWLLTSLFDADRSGLPEIISYFNSGDYESSILRNARLRYRDSLAKENVALGNILRGGDWKAYAAYLSENSGDPKEATGEYDLFASYYRNTYFGVRQCLEIDAIREFAAELDQAEEVHVVAALISAMTNTASTTTHLAQYLKPTSKSAALNIAKKHSLSIVNHVVDGLERLSAGPKMNSQGVFNLDYLDYLSMRDHIAPGDVIYADPPYFKEHYSRYYHLLDTVTLYDYPELTWNSRLENYTVGRYRSGRIVSDFGKKSKVLDAFEGLISQAYSAKCGLVLSYASTSLLPKEEIVDLARAIGFSVRVDSRDLTHSSQGKSNANKEVLEYLFIMKPPSRQNEEEVLDV